MTVAHSEILELPDRVRDGACLLRLEAAADADKVFHCRFYFDGTTTEDLPSAVDFWPIADERALSNETYEEGLILNGEFLSPRH